MNVACTGFINNIFEVEADADADVIDRRPDIVIEAQRGVAQFQRRQTHDNKSFENDVNHNVKRAPAAHDVTGDTVMSTESIMMKESFGPEMSYHVIDETADVSVTSTVKSDSPASRGGVVGVSTSGAWQRSDDYDDVTMESSTGVIRDEYSHDSPINLPTKMVIRESSDVIDATPSKRTPSSLLREKPALTFDTVVEFKDDFSSDVRTSRGKRKCRPQSGTCCRIQFSSNPSRSSQI